MIFIQTACLHTLPMLKTKNLDSTKRLKFNKKAFSILENQNNNQQYRIIYFSGCRRILFTKTRKKN